MYTSASSAPLGTMAPKLGMSVVNIYIYIHVYTHTRTHISVYLSIDLSIYIYIYTSSAATGHHGSQARHERGEGVRVDCGARAGERVEQRLYLYLSIDI